MFLFLANDGIDDEYNMEWMHRLRTLLSAARRALVVCSKYVCKIFYVILWLEMILLTPAVSNVGYNIHRLVSGKQFIVVERFYSLCRPNDCKEMKKVIFTRFFSVLFL